MLSPQSSHHISPDNARSPHFGRLVVRNPHRTRETPPLIFSRILSFGRAEPRAEPLTALADFVGEVSNGTFLAQVKDAVIAESPGGATEDVDLVRRSVPLL